MERYTYFDGGKWRLKISDTEYSGDWVERLAAYEETGLEPEAVEHLKLASMGKAIAKIKEFEGVPVNRLRELAQAYRLLGNTVYEPNKRGVISTYKVISVHFSGCSILVGWDLLDGIYSNLNGFEISALGKTVFLTREAAEAALKEKEAEHDTGRTTIGNSRLLG
ncbi:hypothetical protein [Ruthenibacterium lactatiformans]|uniref:hypothetical protein n=1 Tax=Ruthenibacterium lactatiformans TaxID=1550024 RepID=UPI002430171D|nr:hypothetical protein [Ruthenibacterium lactatiformans]